MTNLRVVDNDKDEVSVMNGDKEVRGWSYANDQERRVKMLCAREFVEGHYVAMESEPLKSVAAAQEGYHNPIMQVAFRAGFILCREYMARFVEQGGDPATAQSIRANWIPAFEGDPGGPRKMLFSEIAAAEDMGKGPWEWKNPSASVEAAGYALAVMATLGMTLSASASREPI